MLGDENVCNDEFIYFLVLGENTWKRNILAICLQLSFPKVSKCWNISNQQRFFNWLRVNLLWWLNDPPYLLFICLSSVLFMNSSILFSNSL